MDGGGVITTGSHKIHLMPHFKHPAIVGVLINNRQMKGISLTTQSTADWKHKIINNKTFSYVMKH